MASAAAAKQQRPAGRDHACGGQEIGQQARHNRSRPKPAIDQPYG